MKTGSEKLLIFRSAELLGMFSCHALVIEFMVVVPRVEIDFLYIIQVHTYSSAVRIQYVYAVQKQQRERVIVTRKHIKIMRERESIRSHTDFLFFVTKTDTRAQIHAALARRERAHLKRVSSAQTVSCELTTLSMLMS